MTRWKPSVSSRSASCAAVSAGLGFTAASAMGNPPSKLFSVSVQIVGVFLDVLGQAEGVVAHEVLGALGVARLERLDDAQMIADRAVGAVLLADGPAPDHPHMGEQVLRERDQHAVAAHADDGLVELDVDLGIFVEPGVQLAVLELREHGAQRSDLVGARVLGDEPRGHALERGPGGDHFDHLALGLANDVNSPPGNRAHETFALELGHGFAHRRAADAEIRCEPALVEPDVGPAAIDVHRHDRVFERRVGAAFEAVRAADWLDAWRYRGSRGMGRGCDPDAGSTGVTITATHGWYTIFQNRGHAQWRRFRQADAGRAPSRPFLPSALQRRPGAQSRERL